MGKIIGVAVLIVGFIMWRRWKKLPSEQAQRKYIFQAAVGGILVVILVLALTGRIHPLGAVFAALIPMLKVWLNLLIRWFPLMARIYGSSNAKPTALRSTAIELEINFGTGELSGTVLSGEYTGQPLQSLNEEQLRKLLNYCRQQDKKSTYLLQVFLAKHAHGKAKEWQNGNTQRQSDTLSPGAMSRDEAAEILGVSVDASKENVSIAHKKLIGKVHPDKGGSDYLASLLNRARDRLLDK